MSGVWWRMALSSETPSSQSFESGRAPQYRSHWAACYIDECPFKLFFSLENSNGQKKLTNYLHADDTSAITEAPGNQHHTTCHSKALFKTEMVEDPRLEASLIALWRL